jgi:cysteine desulfurase/selenocysteine lyase
MTSSNSDGHGPFPVPPGGRLPADFAESRSHARVPTGGKAGQAEAPSPADFGTVPVIDTAFLTALANELYTADGPLEEVAAEMPAPAAPPVNWQDPGLFRGLAEEFMPPMPAGLPEAAAPAQPAGSEAYYFLAQPAPPSSRSFQVEAIRQDFPILHQTVHGKPLVWLDNAATTQKPRRVIDALTRFYENDNSNIHRGAHTLAARATDLYEGARDKVRRFLGASAPEEIIFVHGATEAINLVAQAYGRKFLDKGDEIVLTEIEHHANIVPWQQLAREKGAVLRVVPVNDRGEVLLEEYERLLGPRTRLVALAQVSNALGTVLPVRTMTQLAHRHGARMVLDGAQSVPHMAVDVQALDCDFFAFSGHKLFGPTGVGVLYGKRELLEAMPPWQGGGNMIDQVTFENTTYQQAPAKFEAGTAIIAGAVGLGAAIDYLDELGMDNIARYEHELMAYATEALAGVRGLRPIGTAAEKASVLSFVLDGVRTEDVGRYLDQEGIAVRAGHHCAQPAMRRFGVAGTVRPSLAFYNTPAEIDALTAALHRISSHSI